MRNQRHIKRHLKRYKRLEAPIPAILGDYSKVVEVPDRVGYVYVRLVNQEVTEVFNNKVPPLLNLQVFIGYDDKEPQLLQVLSVRSGMQRTKGGDPFLGQLRNHHETHEWMNPSGGQDVVFVQGRQIMPFRPTPIGENGMNLYQGISWINGRWEYFSGTSFDLTNYRPQTGALYGLIYEDIDATYGFLTGTLRDIATLTLDDIPDPIPGTLPIAAVRLWAGSTGIYETRTSTDVVDLRWPFVNSFLRDFDTPSSYAGSASRFVAVRADETGLEFIEGQAGGGGTNTLAIYDNNAFEVTGSAVVFNNMLDVSVTGSFAYIENGLHWINVKDYGAKGDGVTDDTTAISNAISAMPSTGGVLYFPAGEYVTSGGFILAYNTLVLGVGMGLRLGTDAITQINCTSATAVLFTVNADWSEFKDIALKNTAGSTPSAGSGIKVTNGANYNQRVDYDHIAVYGFYIDVDIQVGAYWTMSNCQIAGPVLYGVKIQNTINADAGDWFISDTNFNTGSYAPDAAIRIQGSGGGKIDNIKVNQHTSGNKYNHGIDVNMANGVSTSVLLISNASIENIRGDAVHVVTAGTGSYNNIVIGNLQTGLFSNTTGYAIYINAASSGNVSNVVIDNCVLIADAANANPAISMTNVVGGAVANIVYAGFDSLISRTTCSGIYVVNPGTDAIEVAEISAPGTPPTGDGYIYEKTDGKLYFKNDAGTEYDLTDAGSFDISALTEELTIDGINDEAVFYDDSASAHRKIPPWRFQSSSRMIYAQTADQQIISTTDETTLLGGGSGTLTIPANALLAGTTIRIKSFGELSDTGTPSPTLKITLGGITLATVTPTLASVTGVNWSFEGWISIRTIGATGTVQAGGLFDYDDGADEFTLLSASDVTIDTTTALDVDLTWTWDVSSASNDITSRWSEVEMLNPPPGLVTAGSAFRITEAGDSRITEASDVRITEGIYG